MEVGSTVGLSSRGWSYGGAAIDAIRGESMDSRKGRYMAFLFLPPSSCHWCLPLTPETSWHKILGNSAFRVSLLQHRAKQGRARNGPEGSQMRPGMLANYLKRRGGNLILVLED